MSSRESQRLFDLSAILHRAEVRFQSKFAMQLQCKARLLQDLSAILALTEYQGPCGVVILAPHRQPRLVNDFHAARDPGASRIAASTNKYEVFVTLSCGLDQRMQRNGGIS